MTLVERDRTRLRQHIIDDAVVRRKVTLACNEESDFYIDMRRVALGWYGAPLVGRVMLELVKDLEFEAVGGLTLGADPVALAMLHAVAAVRGAPLDVFVVRKESKDHGMQHRVEGPSISGKRVLVVDDVITTGRSVLEAVDAVRAVGAVVVAVASVVRRGTAHLVVGELEHRTAFTLLDLGLEAPPVVEHHWSWEDMQISAAPGRVMLVCPGAGDVCERYGERIEGGYPSLGLFKERAEAHIRKAHREAGNGVK